MKLLSVRFLPISLSLILACSGPVAQNDSSQGATEKMETEADAGTARDSHASSHRKLEQDLERLNDLIANTPSLRHHHRADVLFRLGRFKESVQDYNAAARYGRPHNEDSCWERGLAQYYAGDFRGGKDQFTRYHTVGPTDIENGIWRFLCIAEEEGITKARDTMLTYPRKRRGPFPSLLVLYLDQGIADAVLEEARRDASSAEELNTNLFNAHYYLGKYYEIVGQGDVALQHIREALNHEIQQFMFVCAKVDEKRLEAHQNPTASKDEP